MLIHNHRTPKLHTTATVKDVYKAPQSTSTKITLAKVASNSGSQTSYSGGQRRMGSGSTKMDDGLNGFGELLDPLGRCNDVVDNMASSLDKNAGLTRLGSNGKLYFETAKGGIFRSNQYISTISIAKYGTKIVKVTGPLGLFISGGQIGFGFYKDGNKFGYHTKVATGGALGGMAGAWVGAGVGLKAGAAFGGSVGVWFFGVGVAPGATVGGVIGSAAGGIAGGIWGSDIGESIFK